MPSIWAPCKSRTPPDGRASRTVRCGEACLYEADGSDGAFEAVAGIVFSARVAQGLHGTMVLVAAAATRRPFNAPGRAVAPHGRWTVGLSLPDEPGFDDVREIVVQAWVERNDLLYGNRRGQQSTVEGEDPVPEPTEYTSEALLYFGGGGAPWADPALPEAFQPRPSLGTLAGAATPKRCKPFFSAEVQSTGHVVAVGGLRLADDEVPSYSSGGPAYLSSSGRTSAARAVLVGNASGSPPRTTPGDTSTASPSRVTRRLATPLNALTRAM